MGASLSSEDAAAAVMTLENDTVRLLPRAEALHARALALAAEIDAVIASHSPAATPEQHAH